jgi:tetratricopeptide (TPR) repeat protein
LGQIHLVRNQVSGGDDYQAAIKAFEQVIQAYEGGNVQVIDHASHAYARLGIIHHLMGENDLAVEYYGKAIEIASPAYQASNWATLGEIYLVMGQQEAAVNAYREAIQVAEFYGDEAGVMKYERRLSEIE